ncbi:MAG: hypothetical protein ATN33_00150 [Epulopiscium sp. Nele67-Bin001]|nr:MAG: hypothetical protein ATN33_00150 [Epulopiscium sp. Nele67-Bin001]
MRVPLHALYSQIMNVKETHEMLVLFAATFLTLGWFPSSRMQTLPKLIENQQITVQFHPLLLCEYYKLS